MDSPPLLWGGPSRSSALSRGTCEAIPRCLDSPTGTYWMDELPPMSSEILGKVFLVCQGFPR